MYQNSYLITLLQENLLSNKNSIISALHYLDLNLIGKL